MYQAQLAVIQYNSAKDLRKDVCVLLHGAQDIGKVRPQRVLNIFFDITFFDHQRPLKRGFK